MRAQNLGHLLVFDQHCIFELIQLLELINNNLIETTKT